MEIRVLRGAEVRQLLPMGECIDLMRGTMIAVSEGRVVLPLRSILVMPGDRGMMGMMPGYLADPECFGVKLVSLIPRNKPPQYSSHLGLVLLFEAEHGQPVALLDAAEITAIRTAAASGLATRLLAQEEAGDLALLGAGEQARWRSAEVNQEGVSSSTVSTMVMVGRSLPGSSMVAFMVDAPLHVGRARR